MSRESWEFDNNSSKEDIELTELNRRPVSYSDSSSSADHTTSCGKSITQAENSEDEAFYSAVSTLNSSDENNLVFDSCRTSSRSLEGTSTGALTRKARTLEGASITPVSQQGFLRPSSRSVSSLDNLGKFSPRKISCLGSLTTRRISSLKRTSIRRVSSLERLSPRKTWVCDSSQDKIKDSSPREVPSLNILGVPLTRRALSLEGLLTRRALSLEGLLTRRALSLEGLLTRRVSSLEEPLTRRDLSREEPLVRRVSSLEEPLVRRVSSLEEPLASRVSSLEEPLVKRVSSLKEPLTVRVSSLERPLKRKVSSLNQLTGPIRSVLSLDTVEVPATGRVASLDFLERPEMDRVASLDSLERPATGRVASLDPLEGPSTRTDFFSGSAEGSLSSVFQPNLSETETETIEYVYNEPPAEHSGHVLSWLKSFLRRQSRKIRHSVYYPLILLALTAIPYSAGYMGCTHLNLCSGCPKLPLLIYLTGTLGWMILFLQLTSVLSRRYFSPHLDGHEFNTWIVNLCLPFVFLLILEMFTVYLCEPVFLPPHKEFCAKVFYNYVYYGNITVPIIILLMMIIIIPGHYDPAEAE